MSLRAENLLREVRSDQCRCRRCSAPILTTTAKRLQKMCAPCFQVPLWAHVFGVRRRKTLLVIGSLIALGVLFHAWNLYNWTSQWRETFIQHPVAYGIGTFLALTSLVLVLVVFKLGKRARRRNFQSPNKSKDNSIP